ncbi:hypothetical protein OUZ56_008904 [Daphnia magna]|uniref:Uncharacterized protein n=1 Tax=Daphnia magna TaxID=35525 RepID=A0ABR0AEI2_9CRUS|nr:hypothetical protein OUZ56_008904 [Daphnia magna]
MRTQRNKNLVLGSHIETRGPNADRFVSTSLNSSSTTFCTFAAPSCAARYDQRGFTGLDSLSVWTPISNAREKGGRELNELGCSVCLDDCR